MRVCFTSDLHGDPRLYAQLEELIRAAAPDLLILGGDLMPDGDPADPLGTQVRYVRTEFLPRMAAWRALLPGMRVACVPGNHEWLCTRDVLAEAHAAGQLVLLDHERPWIANGLTFLGYPSTPATPHWAKDFERLDRRGDGIPEFGGVFWNAATQTVERADLTTYFGGRPTIADELQRLPVLRSPWVFVAHAPPFDTALDRLFEVPYPIGSRAVRQAIEENRPILSLHGHVHDSPEVTGKYSERLGETLAINPGQGFDRLHAVLFDTDRLAATLRHTVHG
jgi:uncharacterized protein